MSGPMSAYKEKQQIADSFIERLKPYEKLTPLRFDLRGYAKFLKENGIRAWARMYRLQGDCHWCCFYVILFDHN